MAQHIGSNLVGRKGLLGSAAAEEDQELVWIQCARFLMTLTSIELEDLLQCLRKVLNNLIAHPGDEKFSSLRFSNAYLQKHLFSYNGGKEVLMGVGFRVEMTVHADGSAEKVLRLPVAYAQAPPPFLAQARSCLLWLENTGETLQDLIAQKEGLEGAALRGMAAESVVLLALPSQSLVRGGFLLQDTAHDLHQFARSFFRIDKRDEVFLLSPDSPQPLPDSETETLLSLSLFPRTRLQCVAREREEAMEESRRRVAEGRREQKEERKVDRRKQEEEKREREEQRRKVLEDFREDRERKKGGGRYGQEGKEIAEEEARKGVGKQGGKGEEEEGERGAVLVVHTLFGEREEQMMSKATRRIKHTNNNNDNNNNNNNNNNKQV